jgi:hypothetical protein
MAEDESLIQLEITTEPPEYVSYEDEAAVVAVDGEHSQQHSLSEPPLSSDDVKINRDTPPPTNGGMAEEGASEGMPGGGTAEQTAEQPTSQHIPVVIFAHTPPPQVDIQESPNPPAGTCVYIACAICSLIPASCIYHPINALCPSCSLAFLASASFAGVRRKLSRHTCLFSSGRVQKRGRSKFTTKMS